jgi:tRNA threonylcarbamoyladenosine biosynthesis protein TsaE
MDIVFQLAELPAVVQEVWNTYQGSKIWALYGEMGAGKTTFVHALCAYLQVKDAISSPTFAIVNEYRSPVAGTIFHMDWYRLKNEEEAIQAGLEDCLLSGSFCLVEWPGKAPGLLPDDTLRLELQFVDTQTRRLTISA